MTGHVARSNLKTEKPRHKGGLCTLHTESLWRRWCDVSETAVLHDARAGDGRSEAVASPFPERFRRERLEGGIKTQIFRSHFEVHINRHKTSGAGRLVMRMRGVLKLLLNTPIFPTTRQAWKAVSSH